MSAEESDIFVLVSFLTVKGISHDGLDNAFVGCVLYAVVINLVLVPFNIKVFATDSQIKTVFDVI